MSRCPPDVGRDSAANSLGGVKRVLVVGDVRVRLGIADTALERARGLTGRAGHEGAMLIERTRCVHTFGMRFAIDVAHLDSSMTVLRVTTMSPRRVGAWVRSATRVLEAEAGSFARWGLAVGDRVAVVENSGASV